VDRAGNIVRYGCHMQIAFSTLLQQNGGHVLNAALDSCVIASEECADALQFEVDLSRSTACHGACSPESSVDDMFKGGRLSMIVNGRWAAVPTSKRWEGDGGYRSASRGDFGRGCGGPRYGDLLRSAKKKEAWEFVKFLVSDEGRHGEQEGRQFRRRVR